MHQIHEMLCTQNLWITQLFARTLCAFCNFKFCFHSIITVHVTNMKLQYCRKGKKTKTISNQHFGHSSEIIGQKISYYKNLTWTFSVVAKEHILSKKFNFRCIKVISINIKIFMELCQICPCSVYFFNVSR